MKIIPKRRVESRPGVRGSDQTQDNTTYPEVVKQLFPHGNLHTGPSAGRKQCGELPPAHGGPYLRGSKRTSTSVSTLTGWPA
jgi:hypothetical protein